MSLSFSLQRSISNFHLDVSAEISDGEICGIYGRSGAGKTTLMRCLTGLESADGNITLNGESLLRANSYTPPHERRIGYVSQSNSLLPHLSVQKNLQFAERRAKSTKPSQLQSFSEMMGVAALLTRMPSDLSGGESRRVAIVRALLAQPKLLLLDEPLTGLHGEARENLVSAIAEVQHETGICVLWVSHDIQELAHIANTLLILQNGRRLNYGPIAKVLCDVNTQLDREAGSVWACSFAGESDNLLELAMGSARLRLPKPGGFKPGQPGDHRLYIPASAVSITLQPAVESSILNILPVTISEIGNSHHGQVLIKLDANGTAMLARISQYSLAAMGIRVGMQAYAQIKAVSLINS